jgi:E3 ubiquitin-protein ligase TRIP12
MSSRVRPERKGYDVIIYQQHVDRLKKMKPSVDAGPPRAHPLSNKREMDKRREFLNIEFDNKLMLERLAKVVQNKSIDNEIHKSVEMHARFKKKLILTKKRIEMQRLTEDNQRILKRIQEVPPAYNHLEWEEDARRKEHIKRCMALYPEYYERLDKEKDEQKRSTKMRNSGQLTLSK